MRKRITAMGLFCIMLVTSLFSGFSVSAEEGEFAVGDVDKNGDAGLSDAILVLKHVAQIITLEEDAVAIGDVDGDGDLTVTDAVYILKKVAEILDDITPEGLQREWERQMEEKFDVPKELMEYMGVEWYRRKDSPPKRYMIDEAIRCDLQGYNQCWAYSLAMILRYLDEDIHGEEFFEEFPYKYDDNTANPEDLARYLKEREGYKAHLYMGTQEDVKDALTKYGPVMLLVHMKPGSSRSTWHYMDLTGYDENFYYFSDPLSNRQIGDCYNWVLYPEELEAMWHTEYPEYSYLFFVLEKDHDNESGYAKTIQVGSKLKAIEGVQYPTLEQAFDYVNDNPPKSEEERIRILVSPGTYREHLVLEAPYVTLEGNCNNARSVLITWYYGSGRLYESLPASASNQDTASVGIAESAHDFVGKGVTFENSFNLYITDKERKDYSAENEITLKDRIQNIKNLNSKYKKQALALSLRADRAVFEDCRFLGVQDTLLLDNYARCYLKDCYIQGTTDFIFGSATAVFEDCQINIPFQSGYVTASSAELTAPYGFLFVDCDLMRKERYAGMEAPKDNSCTLGRPWGALCQVIFWNCRMDKHIIEGQNRYVNMNNSYPREDCRLYEGNTMDMQGSLLDLSAIVPDYMKILTEKEYEEHYTPLKHLAAKYNPKTKTLEAADNWNPMGE